MGYASQPKLASSLPNKRPSFYSADRLGRWAPCGAILYAACRRQNHTTGLRPWKTGKPPCGRWKCTPSAACGGVSPGGGDLLYGFLRSYVVHCLVSIVPPLLRGGKGTGFVGSPWTPENPVTRFPVEKGGAEGTKGGKRPKAAHHRNAVPPDESKGIQPEPAGSRKLEADSPHLYIQRLLPADWYLAAFLTLTALTARILHRMRESTKVGP